jgi:hypothetical protein
MRDSTIIYRSFYESVKELPVKNQAEIWSAIFEYSLNFNEVVLSGVSKTIFTLIKPQLDANIKRFKSGSAPKNKPRKSKPKAKPKQNGSEHEANPNENNNLNLNENLNLNYTFDDFWKEYPVKKGDKKRCKQKFEKLLDEERNLIRQTLPSFILHKPFPSYNHPNPETYLNQKRWQDEIPNIPVIPIARTGDGDLW